MKRALKKILILTVAIGLPLFAYNFVFINMTSINAQETKIKQAPSFEATGHDGNLYKLDDLKGKWVVLEWFNNQCPFVEKHYGITDTKKKMGNMQALQKKYTDQGVVWLTVASSAKGKQGFLTNKTAKQVIQERSAHPTAILLDPSGKLAKSYGASATPHMFVIDPDGNIFYEGAIDDQPSFRKSTLENANNFVAKALDLGLSKETQKRAKLDVASHPVYGCSIKNSL